jgi:hypothetical protein
MAEIITPKNLFDELVQGMTRPLSWRPVFSMNRPQKWFGYFTVAAVGVQILAVIAVWVFPWVRQGPFARYVGKVFFTSWGLSLFSMLCYSLATFVLIFRTKTALDPLANSFNAGLDLITRLAQTYELRHLEYAQDCLTLGAQHLRSRIAWLVGVIDKVGLIPLAITAYFSYQKIVADQQQAILIWPPKDWVWILWVSVVTIYLMSTYLLSIAQQFDRFCVVLKHAIQAKKSVPSSDHRNSLGTLEAERPTVLSHHNL